MGQGRGRRWVLREREEGGGAGEGRAVGGAEMGGVAPDSPGQRASIGRHAFMCSYVRALVRKRDGDDNMEHGE